MSAQGDQNGGGSDFERALAESAELLRDMTREVEKATRGLAGLGGAAGSGGFKSSGDGGDGKGKAGIARIGAGILGGVAAVAGREALLSFGRAGDPAQGFFSSTVQAFDFTGLHKPTQQAGAATLGVLGQAAASGANVTKDDVSREFSFQLSRAERMRQVEHLVDEEVNSRVVERWNDAALDTLKSIEEAIRELPDRWNPFGGGSR